MATGKVAMTVSRGPTIVPNIPRSKVLAATTVFLSHTAPERGLSYDPMTCKWARSLLLSHVLLQFSAIDLRNVTFGALKGARRLQFRNGASGNFLRCSSDDHMLILHPASFVANREAQRNWRCV